MDLRVVVVTVLIASSYGYAERTVMEEMGHVTGAVLRGCWTRAGDTRSSKDEDEVLALMIRCLRRRTLLALNRVFNSDVIPLTDTVQLVRFWSGSKDNHSNENRSVDFTTNAFDVVMNVFKTHTIRIITQDDNVSQGRIRRKHGVMPILMFGLVGLGMILIPMGFQFLAVLGGKALLLAKMALMLTSIQGLKKVATSNIHYGLYHQPPSGPWFDRKTEDQNIENYYSQIPGNDIHTTYIKRISNV